MQTANVNLPIQVTGRHLAITEPIHAYAVKKVEGLHLDNPRIIEAQFLLEVQKHRHIAEVLLYCANHITIEAVAEAEDLYAAMDAAMAKVARQMRKWKTRLMRQHRPRNESIKTFNKTFLDTVAFEEHEEAEPNIVETETYAARPMFVDEAVLQLELSEKEFIVFTNAKTEKVNVLYRRKSEKSYGLIEPHA